MLSSVINGSQPLTTSNHELLDINEWARKKVFVQSRTKKEMHYELGDGKTKFWAGIKEDALIES